MPYQLRSTTKRRKTGPKSWKQQHGMLPPPYSNDIDFDAASTAWMKNKVAVGGGEYAYVAELP